MHCCCQHNLSLILSCSAQGTRALLDSESGDYSCCWPGTQRGMPGEYAMVSPTAYFSSVTCSETAFTLIRQLWIKKSLSV